MNDNDSLVSLTDSDDNFTYPSWYDETWKYLDILGKNTGYVPFDWQRENIHKRT